jgi:circadian clock protein KaiC
MTEKRIQTGIGGLDEMLHGGFLPNSAILVRGAPGTGKTSLAFQFLINGSKTGESGLFITFEEFPHSLYRDADSLGFDLRALEASGKLRIIFTSPEVLLRSLKDLNSPIYQTILENNIQRAVVDSMTHFSRLSQKPRELRQIHSTVINSLRREQITTLMLGEENRTAHRRTDRGGLAYLSDGLILMQYVEVESAIQRAIVVIKLRGSDHAREIRHYKIQKGGLVIEDIFQHHGAILSGISRRQT